MPARDVKAGWYPDPEKIDEGTWRSLGGRRQSRVVPKWKEGPYHGDPSKGSTYEWDVQLSAAGKANFKQFGLGGKGYINVAPDGMLSH